MWANRDISMTDMPSVLKGRSAVGICRKASRLGLCRPQDRLRPEIDYDYLKKLTEVIEG